MIKHNRYCNNMDSIFSRTAGNQSKDQNEILNGAKDNASVNCNLEYVNISLFCEFSFIAHAAIWYDFSIFP